MKLELKHLAGYLPYGLTGIYNGRQTEIEFISKNGLLTNDSFQHHLDFSEFKPILRPLSDLTKEIEVNGEKFVPITELLKIKYKSFYEEKLSTRYSEIDLNNYHNYAESFFKYHSPFSIKVWYNSLKEEPYWVIEKLYEWHFDIHNLIENNLAIDKNTIL